jgi:hypothetical protein
MAICAHQAAQEHCFCSIGKQFSQLGSIGNMILSNDPDAFVKIDKHDDVFIQFFWSYGAAKKFLVSNESYFHVMQVQ